MKKFIKPIYNINKIVYNINKIKQNINETNIVGQNYGKEKVPGLGAQSFNTKLFKEQYADMYKAYCSEMKQQGDYGHLR